VKNARVHPIKDRIEEMQGEGLLTEAGARNLSDCVTPEGYLRLFPGAFGTDGFFVAVLEKTNG